MLSENRISGDLDKRRKEKLKALTPENIEVINVIIEEICNKEHNLKKTAFLIHAQKEHLPTQQERDVAESIRDQFPNNDDALLYVFPQERLSFFSLSEESAATRIQALARGKLARKLAKQLRDELDASMAAYETKRLHPVQHVEHWQLQGRVRTEYDQLDNEITAHKAQIRTNTQKRDQLNAEIGLLIDSEKDEDAAIAATKFSDVDSLNDLIVMGETNIRELEQQRDALLTMQVEDPEFRQIDNILHAFIQQQIDERIKKIESFDL